MESRSGWVLGRDMDINELDKFLIRLADQASGTTEDQRIEEIRSFALERKKTATQDTISLIKRAREGDKAALAALLESLMSLAVEFALVNRPASISRTWAINACLMELRARIINPEQLEPLVGLEAAFERAMRNVRGWTLATNDFRKWVSANPTKIIPEDRSETADFARDKSENE